MFDSFLNSPLWIIESAKLMLQKWNLPWKFEFGYQFLRDKKYEVKTN